MDAQKEKRVHKFPLKGVKKQNWLILAVITSEGTD